MPEKAEHRHRLRRSPGCSCSCVKSMVRPSRRGGVPVFSRPCGSFSSFKRADSGAAGGSPARPAAVVRKPTWIWPSRKVPAVSTTARPRKRMPTCVTAPTTRSPSSIRSSTACWNSHRLGWFSSRRRIAALYSTPVGLRAGGPHRRPLRAVEDAELDPGLVGGHRHGAAQRVDLLDQVALADAADRRIAAHLPERLDAVRQQQRRCSPCAPRPAPPRCPAWPPPTTMTSNSLGYSITGF